MYFYSKRLSLQPFLHRACIITRFLYSTNLLIWLDHDHVNKYRLIYQYMRLIWFMFLSVCGYRFLASVWCLSVFIYQLLVIGFFYLLLVYRLPVVVFIKSPFVIRLQTLSHRFRELLRTGCLIIKTRKEHNSHFVVTPSFLQKEILHSISNCINIK